MPKLDMLYFAEDSQVFAVTCENGIQWLSLPDRAEVGGVDCYKDNWNSVSGTANYREIE